MGTHLARTVGIQTEVRVVRILKRLSSTAFTPNHEKWSANGVEDYLRSTRRSRVAVSWRLDPAQETDRPALVELRIVLVGKRLRFAGNERVTES
jgi:hypothetical protein